MGWKQTFQKKMKAAGMENDIPAANRNADSGGWQDKFRSKMEAAGMGGDIIRTGGRTAADVAPSTYKPDTSMLVTPGVPAGNTTSAAGNEDQSFFSRAGKTVTGGLKGSLAGNMDAMGVAYQAGQGGRTQRNTAALKDAQWAVARAKYAYDTDKSPASAAELDNALKQMKAYATVLGDGAYDQALKAAYDAAGRIGTADLNKLYESLGEVNVDTSTGVQQKATKASRDLALQVQQSGSRDIDAAKEGVGTFGQMVIDAGASMAQMGGDLAANALLGTPGSMMPFATRAFGGATMQAREGGGDLKQQIAYGAVQAGKEVLTEKMFNMALPFAKAYGGGALDDVTQRAIQTAVDKLGKTAAGKRALNAALQLTASGVGEGLEELIGDWMEWQMPRIYGGDVDTAGETLANSLYDFVVGGMAGVAGSVISPGTYSYGRYAADVRQNTAPEMDGRTAEAVEAVTRGETITGNQAAAIARDPVAVETLEASTGVKLDTEKPISQLKREIIALASRETAQEQTQRTTAIPRTQKRAQKAVGGFMEAGQRAYQQVRETSGSDAEVYAGFSAMYNAGLNGVEAEKAKGKYAAMLTPEQRYTAYNAGLEDARAQVARENADAASVTTTAVAGLADNAYSRYIIAKDKGAASALNTIGKKLGVRIEFVDSIMDGQANGQYIREKNLIQIAADSTNPIYEVAGHEVTHRMQDLSPDEYRAFRQAAIEYRMRENGADTETEVVQRYMEAAERAGVTLTQDEVMDEIAADFAGRMIEDTDLFAQFAKDNRTAAQKLLDGLKEFIAKVKAMFTGKARDNAAMDAYGKTFGELEDIAQKWQAAFDAAERQAEKTKTAAGEGDGVKYSLKNTSDKTVVSIKQQIANASKTLNDTEPVVQKNVSEIFSEMNIKQKRAWAEKEALKYGNRVDRQGYGEIEVSRKDVNSALNYLQSDGEIAAFAALPYVLKRGKEIYREADHKGRGYSTVTFAAPVVINGVRGNMAVVVRETSKNHYDMHRIVMPDGSAFTFAEKTNAETGPTAATSSTDALTQPTASTSKNSIPADGENVKPQFSLKATDSTGRKLSEQQQEFFKDSKVRDAEGRLKTVYHGSSAQFTKFSADFMSKNGSSEGQGFYFTDLKTMAQGYEKDGGQLLEGYLDIKNPLSDSEVTLSNAEVKRLIKAIDPTGDDLVLNYDSRGGIGYPSRTWYNRAVNDTLRMTMETSESDSEILAELANGMGNPGAVLKAAREVLGYDGYIVEGKYDDATVYVAFDSSQFKNVDNLNPTSNPDIRYQLRSTADIEQEVRELKRERTVLASRNRALEQRVQELKGEMRISKEPSVVLRDVKKLGREAIRKYGSDVKYGDIQADMEALGKAVMKKDVSMADLMPYARNAATAIVDNTTELTEHGAELLEIKDYLKRQKILFNGEMDHYNEFRKRYMGTLKLNKSEGLPVDTMYEEMTEMFGEGYFPSDVYTEADKLQQIADVLDSMDSIYENPFDSYRDAAIQEIANDIIDGMISDQVRQKKTFADRRELEKQEAVGRVREMLTKEREKRRDMVKRMRREYSEKTQKGREKRYAAEMRAKIARHTGPLSEKLLRPTDKKHIPEELRVVVADLLRNINLESAYSYDENGRLRKNAGGDPTRRTQKAVKLKKAYEDIISREGNMVVDPDLLDSGGLLDSLAALGGKRIADMNVTELETVWNAVRAIEATLTSYDRTLANQKYARTSEWADSLMIGSMSRKRRNRKISLDMADPYTFFSAYGDGGMQVYRTLRNAQDREHVMLTELRDAAKKVLDADVYKNRFERHTFTTSRGVELTLTNEQIMNLYNLAKRGEQAMNHLMVGGIVQPEIKRDGKLKTIPRGTENILLTLEDVRAITSVLTPEQIKVADGLQKLASTKLAEWGNEASMAVYGYRKFMEAHYWPIKTAKEATASSVEKGPDIAREIKNMGSAKALTPNASNALDIGGVYDVFAQNASDMIKYATLLAPIEDINRLYNYRYRDSMGNLTGKNVRQVLSGVYGDAAQSYWRNLMRDVQNGMVKNASATTRAVERIVGNTKGAAVGANLRVVIQQPTAYFRAAVVLDPENMAKGLGNGVTKGNGWDKARKWAPIAGIKDTSGFDQGSRYTIAREVYGTDGSFMEWLSDKSMSLAGKADAMTWGKIWNACEWQVAADTSLEVGSDAYYQQVAEVFTDVIDQTQVVDGIMQRTQIMRNSDALTRQATSFMGEPLKSLNILMRSYDAWVYETNPQKRSKALKQLKRAVGALLVTDVVNALAQSIVDGLRDDDKDKKYWERVLEAFTGITGEEKDFGEAVKNITLQGNVKGNITLVGRIPYAKDIISILQGYTVDRMDAGAVDDIVRATKSMISSANGQGKKTAAYNVKQFLTVVSKIFGVSVANLGRDTWAIARSIASETGNVRLMFEMEKAIYRMDKSAGNRKTWCELLYRAQKDRDTETARLIYREMLAHGYEETDVRQGVEAIMKQEQGVNSVKELRNRWMAP
nr:MAG TPA: PolyVal ADP-Ribosyltransferase [Caudoviricetes sp.]